MKKDKSIFSFFHRHGGGFMWKGIICVNLPGQHWWLCCHPRPGCSHQTQSPPRELLFLWVPVNKTPNFPPSQLSTQFQFVCWPCPVLCFSPQSTMRAWWRTCRYAKHSKCDFCIDKKNEKLSACLVSGQTIPFSLRCVLILLFCVCSEVQDRWPANEAVPQRKPPQKDALCQQQTHRERAPLYEAWVAGCAVSHPSVHCL